MTRRELLALPLAAADSATPVVARVVQRLLDTPMSPVRDVQAFRNGRWKLDDFADVLELVPRPHDKMLLWGGPPGPRGTPRSAS